MRPLDAISRGVIRNGDVAAIATRRDAAGAAGTTRARATVSACPAIAAFANGQV